MNIYVHDDQHGTAITSATSIFVNALIMVVNKCQKLKLIHKRWNIHNINVR